MLYSYIRFAVTPMTIHTLNRIPRFLPEIAGWHQAEWGHLNPGRDLDTLVHQMHEYLTEAPIPIMFVWCENGRPGGTSSLIAHDMDTHPEWSPWLANVYVHPDLRGRGVGGRLVAAVMEHARGLGLQTLYLFTTDQEEYYRRMGWRRVCREDYLGEPVTIMVYTFGHTEPNQAAVAGQGSLLQRR